MISSSSSSNIKNTTNSTTALSGGMSARDNLKQLMKKPQLEHPADLHSLNRTYTSPTSIHQTSTTTQQYLVTKPMSPSNYNSHLSQQQSLPTQKSSRSGQTSTQPQQTSNGSYHSPLRNNITSTSPSYHMQANMLTSPVSTRSGKIQVDPRGVPESTFNNFIDINNNLERKSSTGRIGGIPSSFDPQEYAQQLLNKSSNSNNANQNGGAQKQSSKTSASNKMQQMLKDLVGNSNSSSNQINSGIQDRHGLNSSYGNLINTPNSAQHLNEIYKTQLNRTEQISRNEVSQIRSRENSSDRMKMPSNSPQIMLQQQQQYSPRSAVQQMQNVSPMRSNQRPISGTNPIQEQIPSRGYNAPSQSNNTSSKALQLQFQDNQISSQSSAQKVKHQTSQLQQQQPQQLIQQNGTQQQNPINRSNSKPRLAEHLIEATYNSNSRSTTPKQANGSRTTPTNQATSKSSSQGKQQESPNFGGNQAPQQNNTSSLSSAINSVLQQQQKTSQSSKRALEESMKQTSSFNCNPTSAKQTFQPNQNYDTADIQQVLRKNMTTPQNMTYANSLLNSHRDSLAQGREVQKLNGNNQSANISQPRESSRPTTPLAAAQARQGTQSNVSQKQNYTSTQQQQQQQQEKRTSSPLDTRGNDMKLQQNLEAIRNGQLNSQTLKKVGAYGSNSSDVLRAIQEQQRIKQEHFGQQATSTNSSEQPMKQKNKPSADFFESNYFQFNPDVMEQLQHEQFYLPTTGQKTQNSEIRRDSQRLIKENTSPRSTMKSDQGYLSNESVPSSSRQDEDNDSDFALKQLSSESSQSKISNGKGSQNRTRQTNTQKQKLAVQQQIDNESLDTTSTATNYSEELSKSTLAKINMREILSIESNLYELQKNGFTSKSDVTKYCKNYLHIIAEQQVDSLERICSDSRQSNILTRMFVLERICMMLSLNEALKKGKQGSLDDSCDNQDDEESDDDDSAEQIKNTVQYVHLNFLLFVDLIVSKYQFTPAQGDIEKKVRELFEVRMKVKRYSSILSKPDKFQVISNYCDIILPYLKNVVQNYNKEPFLSVANIIKDISTATVAQTTQILMDSFARIIIELEERASKESNRSSVDSQSSSSSAKKNEQQTTQSCKQNEISFEQVAKRSPIEEKQQTPLAQATSAQSTSTSTPSLQPKPTESSPAPLTKNKKAYQEEDDSEEDEEEEEDDFDDDYTRTYEVRGSIPAPYLPPLPRGSKQYTLVLDLDETLVHYEEVSPSGGQFLIRPNAEKFLQIMSKCYEIVIFTAAVKEYADFILDVIDEGSISHRLYRQHTDTDGRSFVKDISKLGRDLSKMIIIDNLPENFSRQPKNGILISSWMGEADDRALIDLIPLLSQIPSSKKFGDVRDALQKYREQMMKNLINGVQDPHIHLDLDSID